MIIEITRPEVEDLINERLQSGAFQDAQEVILAALRSSAPAPAVRMETERDPRAAAIARLMAFGKTHGLSLGGLTLRELRDEARP